jgi:hypothetical protein
MIYYHQDTWLLCETTPAFTPVWALPEFALSVHEVANVRCSQVLKSGAIRRECGVLLKHINRHDLFSVERGNDSF